MILAIYILILIFTISPFFPAIGNSHWFFRTPDFIRLQSIAIQVVLAVALAYLKRGNYTTFDWLLLSFLIICIAYQFHKVYKYSSLFFSNKTVELSENSVSILAANVLQDNKKYDLFISEVNKYDADLVLVMETDKKWEKALEVIETDYKYTVKVPQDNYYGMHLYSKKKIFEAKVSYLVEDTVPSIAFKYKVSNDREIYFECLHPAPPSPTENDTSNERDAELMIIGKKVQQRNKSTVVCGDMNDVVWSRTTRLFKNMTQMIDPRVGRGFFPTYHANYWFMRFPLDHLFHTKDLYVKTLERTSFFGSDHFGMYYDIYFKKHKNSLPKPAVNLEEKKEAEEIIENGK